MLFFFFCKSHKADQAADKRCNALTQHVNSPLSVRHTKRRVSDTSRLPQRGSDATSSQETQKQGRAGNQRGRAVAETSHPASLTDEVLQWRSHGKRLSYARTCI